MNLVQFVQYLNNPITSGTVLMLDSAEGRAPFRSGDNKPRGSSVTPGFSIASGAVAEHVRRAEPESGAWRR